MKHLRVGQSAKCSTRYLDTVNVTSVFEVRLLPTFRPMTNAHELIAVAVSDSFNCLMNIRFASSEWKRIIRSKLEGLGSEFPLTSLGAAQQNNTVHAPGSPKHDLPAGHVESGVRQSLERLVLNRAPIITVSWLTAAIKAERQRFSKRLSSQQPPCLAAALSNPVLRSLRLEK